MSTVAIEALEPVEVRSGWPRPNASAIAGGLIVALFVVMSIAPGLFSSQIITALNVSNHFAPPSWHHLFGTDEVGRDVFSRVVRGTRSLSSMALAIVVIAASIGTLLGLLSGYAGGWADQLVMRFTDNASSDTYAVWNAANTAQLNLGSVNTKGNYVTTAVTAGASGTPSTMALDATGTMITITLGTIAGTVNTDAANNKAAWTPSASTFDRAGNAMSTTSR